MWNDVKAGKYLTQALEWTYGVMATRARIDDVLRLEGLKRESLDEASNALGNLAITFTEQMGKARGWVTGIGFAITILTPLVSGTPLAVGS